MIPWILGGLVLALGGYHQYTAIKPGDLVLVQDLVVPGFRAKMLVREIKGDTLYGTVAESNTNTDSQIPVTAHLAQVVENLTPRFW